MPPDNQQRQFSLSPSGWFKASLPDNPVLRAVLAMSGSVADWAQGLITYADAQTRLGSATGGWLDIAALDFFGTRLRRRAGQTDDALRSRILAEILRERVTRAGMRRMLLDLTGQEPRIFEPARPLDAGGYGVPNSGYGIGRGYGSLVRRGQVFIDVYRDLTVGAPRIAGYGVPAGKYGPGGYSAYAASETAGGSLTDADILEAMLSVAPAGIVLWTKIQA